jgi:hypothetical protein
MAKNIIITLLLITEMVMGEGEKKNHIFKQGKKKII